MFVLFLWIFFSALFLGFFAFLLMGKVQKDILLEQNAVAEFRQRALRVDTKEDLAQMIADIGKFLETKREPKTLMDISRIIGFLECRLEELRQKYYY